MEDKTAIDKWVVVIKNSDDKSLPRGLRRQVHVNRNANGDILEWFQDELGSWGLVGLYMNQGLLEYV